MNIENIGIAPIPVLPKNKHKRIKGIPTILTNALEFLDFLIIKII